MNEFNRRSNAQQLVSTKLESLGHFRYGFAPLTRPLSLGAYEEWLSEGLHGQMKYLENHLPDKSAPTRLLKKAKSAIVLTFDYLPHPKPRETFKASRLALYARGDDYHFWLKEKLKEVVEALRPDFPDEDFLVLTDSGPVLERDLAYQAGLGWVGKNTCLIDQKQGSLFLIGEILTTIVIESVKPLHPDRCGTCTRCIDACPTGALVAERKMDARKCISYLNIESKDTPPISLRGKMGDYLFGCDICQAVCPWNEKVFGAQVQLEQPPMLNPTLELLEDLRFILSSSNKTIEKHVFGSPLSRARGFGLKRNALIVAANQNLIGLAPDIERLQSDPRLGELATWALSRLSV